MLDGIRAATRGIEDDDLRESTRNLQILVHYLRAYDEIGAEIEALDRADRARHVRRRTPLDEPRFAELVEQAGADADERDVPLPAPPHPTRTPLVGDPARPPPPLTPNLRQLRGLFGVC